MASVVIKADFALDTQQLLNSLDQLNTQELETFYQAVGQLLEQRTCEPSSSLPSVAESSIDEANVPIVETLIPQSITLKGDSILF